MITHHNSGTAKPSNITAVSQATGAKRITDRFVRYPYPPNVGSVYQKEIGKALKSDVKTVAPHKNAFNLEKEPKQQVKHKFTGNSSFVMDYKVPTKVGGKPAGRAE